MEGGYKGGLTGLNSQGPHPHYFFIIFFIFNCPVPVPSPILGANQWLICKGRWARFFSTSRSGLEKPSNQASSPWGNRRVGKSRERGRASSFHTSGAMAVSLGLPEGSRSPPAFIARRLRMRTPAPKAPGRKTGQGEAEMLGGQSVGGNWERRCVFSLGL